MIPVYIGDELQGFLRSGVDLRASSYTFSMLESADFEAMFSDAAVDAGVMPRFKEYVVPIRAMNLAIDMNMLRSGMYSAREMLITRARIDPNLVKVNSCENRFLFEMIFTWHGLFPDIEAYEHIFDFDNFEPV